MLHKMIRRQPPGATLRAAKSQPNVRLAAWNPTVAG
jgi:hypothetical protein